MTPEELMKPRYKVVADYFFSPFEIGDIIAVDEANSVHLTTVQYHNVVGEEAKFEKRYRTQTLNKYPHLFKAMYWWEDRKSEDMPKYVKRQRFSGYTEVLRVLDPSCNYRVFGHEPNTIEHRFVYPDASGYLPATESEYLQYVEAQKQTS